MKDLALKSFAGLVWVVAGFAALLFIPAGTLDYWQAWLNGGICAVAALLTTLYLLRYDPQLLARRLNAGAGAEREPAQKRIQTLSALALMALYLVAGLDHRFGLSHVPAALVYAANAVMALGMVIVWRVFRENSYTASIIQVEEGQPVVDTGPYARVRHPMYAGSMLGFLATPIALGSWWALLPAVVVGLAVVLRLLDEERFLDRNLAGYAEYHRRVPFRLIPGVW
jgi:protein-S-isoprenylcysteine O-methyltransferase Ste14